jgi:hypothetical protein
MMVKSLTQSCWSIISSDNLRPSEKATNYSVLVIFYDTAGFRSYIIRQFIYVKYTMDDLVVFLCIINLILLFISIATILLLN